MGAPGGMLCGARTLLLVLLLSMIGARAWGQSEAALDYRLAPRQLAAGVFVIEGAVADFSPANGCNIINTGFIVTDVGVVVINTGPSKRYGEQQRAAIRRVTDKPITWVLNLNLHPDYFFGNQAYADVPIASLAGTIQGMKREGGAYADNLYRMCGDWMKGTESTPADQAIEPGERVLGGRRIGLMRFSGHTDDDLVLVDHQTGVVFAGGLVFVDRTLTTPHARIPQWLEALDGLGRQPFRIMVPSHGPVVSDSRGIEQTRDYLRWLDQTLQGAATSGQDLTEVLATPIPERFKRLAAIDDEFVRNVTHLYQRYELQALRGQ